MKKIIIKLYFMILDFVGILYEDESMRCMCRVIIRTDELMKQGRKYIPSSVQSLLGSYRTPCFSRQSSVVTFISCSNIYQRNLSCHFLDIDTHKKYCPRYFFLLSEISVIFGGPLYEKGKKGVETPDLIIKLDHKCLLMYSY